MVPPPLPAGLQPLPPPLPVGLQPLPPPPLPDGHETHETLMGNLPTASPLDRWTDASGRINVPYTRAVFCLSAEPSHPSRYPPYDPIKRAIQVRKHNKMEYIDVFSFQ